MSTKEEILKLKEQAEKALVEFKANLKAINLLGYMSHVQANDTLYIFKDTRESYGELLQPPSQAVASAAQTNSSGQLQLLKKGEDNAANH